MAKRTALFYLILGMIWIIFSDLAVESLLPSLDELVHFGMVKGLFFIAVTAGLLYFFVKKLEEQRAKDQRNYRSLFVDNPNAMLVTRKSDGRILTANAAATALYGYSYQELKALFHHELEADAPPMGNMRQLQQHRHKSGQTIWVKEFVSEIEQENGRSLVHLIVSAHEAVEAEAARLAAQERLERLLQGMPDMVLGINREGKINFLNPAFLQHLQATEGEVLGAPASDILRRRNGDWWEAILTNAWAQPRFITERYYAPAGKWLRISSYQSPDGLGMLISDITQQHMLEDTLSQFQLTLEAVVNASDDMIWAVDHQLQLLAANKRFYEAAQTRSKSHLLHDSMLVTDETAPQYAEWKKAYETALGGQKMECMVHHPAAGLTYPTIDLRMYPIKNEAGKVVCVGCFAHDATDRIQRDYQLQKQQKQLLEIAWQQSHEMRAPLANILGISQLLEVDPDLPREEVLTYLHELNQEAAKLDQIIRLIVQKTGDKVS